MTSEEEFLKRLMATFRIEAEEHLTAIQSGLFEVEKEPPPEKNEAIVEAIYREAHSLKGAARSVNLGDVEMVCQAMEDFFSALKREVPRIGKAHLDLLHDTADLIRNLITSPEQMKMPQERLRLSHIRQQLVDMAAGKDVTPETVKGTPRECTPVSPVVSASIKTAPFHEQHHLIRREGKSYPLTEQGKGAVPPGPALMGGHTLTETLRIPTMKLDSLLLKAEEMVSAKLATRQHSSELKELRGMLGSWKERWAKMAPHFRNITDRAPKGGGSPLGGVTSDVSVKAAEFLDWNDAFIKSMDNRLRVLNKSTDETYRSVGTMVDDLLDDMKNVMLLPFASVFETFPRLVRDIAREQGKEIHLTIEGGDIEIDKRVLQEIKDALIHLVRNSIDHGIESQSDRVSNGKSAAGNLSIVVSHKEGNRAEITIADDGAGIDAGKIKALAVQKGIISGDEADALSPEAILGLTFRSGISTSAMITTLSGRGLGLAIVQEKVAKLGGVIAIETTPHAGTAFRISLPLSLSTFRGILIQSGGQTFAVSTKHVERIGRVARTDIKTVKNRETILFNGRTISMVRLDDILELPRKDMEDGHQFGIMVLAAGDQYIAFKIDQVLNEEEILIKNFGRQLSRVRNVSGATVLGTGRVVLILNVSDLVKSAQKAAAGGYRPLAVTAEDIGKSKKSILVVEDSITARTLLVNILESAGYQVTSAVDGLDGYMVFSAGTFDLVCSDVAMPRMDGFELTRKIRADTKQPDIPIVLVTGLESPEDKKKGIEVGASAYLVKSNFDQSNLLDVIGRFV